jgi:hypothetical protein
MEISMVRGFLLNLEPGTSCVAVPKCSNRRGKRGPLNVDSFAVARTFKWPHKASVTICNDAPSAVSNSAHERLSHL